jgi:uncharacterized membrane protein YfcA
MVKITIVAFIIFMLAIVMTVTGRGGGNFYVLTFVLAGVPMHEAATTGQFVLFTTALAASLIFHKNKVLSIPLALFIGLIMVGAAFTGGFLAYLFTGVSLKIIFSILLVVAGIVMFFPVKEHTKLIRHHIGFWHLKTSDHVYTINLWFVIPIILATGFCAGMVGVSGGSFVIPLMVLACGVPMRVAVGTASVLVAATAFSGFLGHALQGSFDPSFAIPIAGVTIIGGILGGNLATKTEPRYLKTLFALTTLAAAILMIINAIITSNRMG